MGQLMQQLWQTGGVQPLHTSGYHPQTNGLVECFNDTLKTMLRKFALTTSCQWPWWLLLLLFAVWEIPQASAGFSPFEFLCGCRPRLLWLAMRGMGSAGSRVERTYSIHKGIKWNTQTCVPAGPRRSGVGTTTTERVVWQKKETEDVLPRA